MRPLFQFEAAKYANLAMYASLTRYAKSVLSPSLPLAMVAIVSLWAGITFTGCEKAPAGDVETQAAKPVPVDLTNAVVIGASVSAGCEASLPGFKPASLFDPMGHCTLSSVLADITGSQEPWGRGDTMFFTKPVALAEEQLNGALARQPSLVFAIDYLFWHVYGSGMTEEQRIARFEEGLARLDRFSCPIVVGDIPDMAHAALLLSKSQIPQAPTRSQVNTRLRAWADERPRVVVIGLNETIAKAIKAESVEFGGILHEGQNARELLTFSGLHVTPKGYIALSFEMLNQLKAKGLIPKNSIWEKDSAVVFEKMIQRKRLSTPESSKPK
jgi:hypothetical protein